ncbi:MAG: hypothetical protein BLITH_1464 [Brockia lithotrophica]|uniref:Uncharacterized protein n=1 Tax=Brockia lithotrophica TaxID=933949 RepID=A0A2T5G5B6_9BACL|nr:MAG: hypothetical protein BLITH_1464 [Brockia lithotrophica]
MAVAEPAGDDEKGVFPFAAHGVGAPSLLFVRTLPGERSDA